MPDEDPDKVSVLLRNAGWFPPKLHCVEKVKTFLLESCHAKEQCYVIDIHWVVENINSVGIPFENGIVKTFDLRFDGVHLSRQGVRYIASLIEKAMTDHPPACAR